MENMCTTTSKLNIDGDRISNLPGDIIHRILEFLPVQDAATTCVLSSNWRYVWADHPSLVLDKQSWDDIHKHKSPEKFDSANIVSSILLLHVGHIREFVIHVPLNVSSNSLDLWLTCLLRRRQLKVLRLKNFDYNDRNGENFTTSRNEVMLVNILLKCAPLLGKLLVEENEQLDPYETDRDIKGVAFASKKISEDRYYICTKCDC